jgi:SAM-dependent methyltransferase
MIDLAGSEKHDFGATARGKFMIEKEPSAAEFWDERFARPEPVYGEEPNDFLRVQATQRLAAGGKVLVPADGYGRNGLWLAKQGFDVTTVDISPVGVERARASAKAAGLSVKILLCDLNTWTWPVSEYDAVASIYLHLSPEQRSKLHAAMLRAVKPGGILIFEAFNPAQLQFSSGGPKQVELLYTAELLCRDFAQADALELTESVVDLREGNMHSGKGAVVRAVFRKK